MNTDVMFSSKTNEWETPQEFYNELNKEFNFNLDPCCTHENAKCDKYFTESENGLVQDWGVTAFLSIHLMAEQLKSGSRKHTTKQKNLILESLCLSHREQTQRISINTFTTKQKSDL